MSMESSRRDLSIDMVVGSFIFKNKQITYSPSFTTQDRCETNETGVFTV